MNRCEFCGATAPVTHVQFRQNTGMLIMRQYRVWAGRACRSCARTLFTRTLLHNVTLGWWGMISLFLTPIFIVSNAYYFARSRSLPSADAARRARLDDHREYALNLLATKDEDTVVDVLARETGAQPTEVQAYLRTLAQRDSQRAS